MTGKRLLLALIVFLSSAGLAPAPTRGSAECIIYGSLDDEFKASSLVFEGRVVAVEWIPGQECCHVLSGWATIRTERWWKGQPLKEIKIGAAGQIFTIGEEYVVFGFGDPPVADGCNSTEPKKKAARALEWLAKKPSRRAG
jgi:hypothetical protein